MGAKVRAAGSSRSSGKLEPMPATNTSTAHQLDELAAIVLPQADSPQVRMLVLLERRAVELAQLIEQLDRNIVARSLGAIDERVAHATTAATDRLAQRIDALEQAARGPLLSLTDHRNIIEINATQAERIRDLEREIERVRQRAQLAAELVMQERECMAMLEAAGIPSVTGGTDLPSLALQVKRAIEHGNAHAAVLEARIDLLRAVVLDVERFAGADNMNEIRARIARAHEEHANILNQAGIR